MGSRRRLVIIGAVVAAALAAFANYAYLSSVQDRAYKDAERLKVLVVAKDIPKGLPGEQALQEEYIKADEIPREFRPTTAIPDATTIRGKVSFANLSTGQVVVEGMFVDPSAAQITFAQRIPPGHVAITLSINQLSAVGGLLVPGDRVNILLSDGRAQRHLYQNVLILAINTAAVPQVGETPTTQPPLGTGSGLITFAVTPVAAARLRYATAEGMYLTLVPPDNQPVPVPPIDAGNLFPSELTP